MQKRRKLLSVALVLLASLLVITPVAARAIATTFTGLEVTCSEAPAEREWVGGDVLHIRNEIVTTRILTTDDRVTGTNTIVLNFNLNLKNGTGGLYGTFHLQPDDVNGTWEGRFSGQFTNFVTSVHATGHGTGELVGLQEMVTLHGTELPGSNPCAAGAPSAATLVTGRILDPHE
jgi:hypothetical protein